MDRPSRRRPRPRGAEALLALLGGLAAARGARFETVTVGEVAGPVYDLPDPEFRQVPLPSPVVEWREGSIVSSGYAWAGLTVDGDLVAWGDSRDGAELFEGAAEARFVQLWSGGDLAYTTFAALQDDGTAVVWGRGMTTRRVPTVRECRPWRIGWLCEQESGAFVSVVTPWSKAEYEALPEEVRRRPEDFFKYLSRHEFFDSGRDRELSVFVEEGPGGPVFMIDFRATSRNTCDADGGAVGGESSLSAFVRDRGVQQFVMLGRAKALIVQDRAGEVEGIAMPCLTSALREEVCFAEFWRLAGATTLFTPQAREVAALLPNATAVILNPGNWYPYDSCEMLELQNVSSMRQAGEGIMLIERTTGALDIYTVRTTIAKLGSLPSQDVVKWALSPDGGVYGHWSIAFLLSSGAVQVFETGSDTSSSSVAPLLQSGVTDLFACKRGFLASLGGQLIMWGEWDESSARFKGPPGSSMAYDAVISGKEAFTILTELPPLPPLPPPGPSPTVAPLEGGINGLRAAVGVATIAGVVGIAAGMLAIRRWRALAGQRSDIFISYRQRTGRSEAVAAYKLLDAAGYRVWMDCFERDVALPEMVRGVQTSRAVLLVLTPSVLGSEYVVRELAHALLAGKPLLVAHAPSFDFCSALNELPPCSPALRECLAALVVPDRSMPLPSEDTSGEAFVEAMREAFEARDQARIKLPAGTGNAGALLARLGSSQLSWTARGSSSSRSMSVASDIATGQV